MKGVYEGLTVLDLSDIKGMYCAKSLAGLGATVIKIEKPGGDDSRKIGPFAPGEEDKINKSLSFAYLNTGKKDITLDLSQEEGKHIFLQLAEKADVVIETFSPGTMEKWGIGYDDLKQVNSELILLSITPFGQTGPHAGWMASTDLIVDAMGGCMPEVGYVGRSPLHMGYDVMASGVSMFGLFAVQAALHNRLFLHTGIHIDLSQQECLAKWRSQCLGDTQAKEKDTPKKIPGGTRQGLVNCKDGFCFVMIGGKWKELMQWFTDQGQDVSVFDDPFYFPHTYEVLTPWDDVLLEHFNELGAHYTKAEFMKEGQRRKIPVGVVDTPDSLLDNEQLKARGYFVEIDHPIIGKYLYPGAPAMMTKSPLITNVPAPLLGADNEEIIGTLGYDIEALKARGII